jgi:cytoskeletal protein CcmA (bactofilin family)
MIFQKGSASELNGFLDAGAHLKGELKFETTFRVDGKLHGTVVSEGTLMIGEGGEVEGEIRVGQVVISGILRGTAHASRRVQLCATGQLLADIHTPALVVEDGGKFEGQCTMIRESTGSAVVTPITAAKER